MRLEQQPAELLRKVAADAVGLAMRRIHLDDPRLDAALAALRDARYGDTSERSGVQQLVDHLDHVAWDIQEIVDTGAASYGAYSAAFSRARAASAVGFALERDPLRAALEAVYEAQAAVADLSAVRATVNDALG